MNKLIVVIFIIIGIFALGFVTGHDIISNIPKLKTSTPKESVFFETVMYDGHYWVVYGCGYKSGIAHSPNCPCHKNNIISGE